MAVAVGARRLLVALAFAWAVGAGDEARVRALLEAGAAVDTKDGKGRTALLAASAAGHEGAAAALLAGCEALPRRRKS